MSPNRKEIVLYSILALTGAVFVVGLLLPVFGSVAFVDPLLRQVFQLSTLSQFLDKYAEDNDGLFPAKIDDLVSDWVPADTEFLKFHDLTTRTPLDWTWFGGLSTRDPRSTILLASPKTISKDDGTRMVGSGAFRLIMTVDGRKALLTEKDYQACIAEQQKPEWLARPEIPASWEVLPVARGSAEAAVAKSAERRKRHSTKDIPHLIKTLKGGGEQEREDAAEALGEIGTVTPEAVSALVVALSDPKAAYHASHALAAISLHDATVVPALVEVVKSGRGDEPMWAAVALEEIGPVDEPAIPLLIAALDRSDSQLRGQAVNEVSVFGPAARGAVPGLIRRLDDENARTGKSASVALGRIGLEAREAIPALTARLEKRHDYWIDAARALWKIDPAQAPVVVSALVKELEAQRSLKGPNQTTDNQFPSAIALLGEIGPEARMAVPILQANLRGGAWMYAAWALARIDPQYSDVATSRLLHFLDDRISPDRLDHLAYRTKYAVLSLQRKDETFGRAFGPRLGAAGMLWQMHPDRRAELRPLIVALLREWDSNRILKDLTPETREAVPALAEIENDPAQPGLRLLARAALRKIATTDYGGW